MNEITITLTPAEIETLIYGCMAAINNYCINNVEREPYQTMIRRLEALEQIYKQEGEYMI